MNADFIPAPPEPSPVSNRFLQPFDLGVEKLLDAVQARADFKVDGSGLTVAVLDTGLRTTHECFTGRVLETRNFLAMGSEDDLDVSDTHGHGTNVTGIIAADADDERSGIAPRANIVALKVIPAPTFVTVQNALLWVNENAERLGITVVNLSLGSPDTNFLDDVEAVQQYPEMLRILESLASKKIAVVVAAGNSYFRFQKEGMSVPAIFRSVISVGAVYDDSFGRKSYRDGSEAVSTHLDQITPFTQRLSKETSSECYTDIFSSGGSVVSAGSESDTASSKQDGTSQAAPSIAGLILLMQEYYKRLRGELPPIPLLQEVLRATSTWILDADRAEDNVLHTEKRFPRANARQSLRALHKALQTQE